MGKQKATEEELHEIWRFVEELWTGMQNRTNYPWSESKFKLEVFKTLVKRRNLKIPAEYGII